MDKSLYILGTINENDDKDYIWVIADDEDEAITIARTQDNGFHETIIDCHRIDRVDDYKIVAIKDIPFNPA